jgi:NADPH:quinone reductase-like Zn-dependent oxidoreductase
MKAAVYTKARLGKVLELKDLEQPVPKDNEVVIRVRAASVNPLDWRGCTTSKLGLLCFFFLWHVS